MNALKHILLAALVEAGHCPMIIVARHIAGVIMPDDASEIAPGAVGLNVGHGLPVPIPDLLIDETGISCTLSFNRTPARVFVPWPALGSIHMAEFVAQFRVYVPEQTSRIIAPSGAGKLRLV